MTILSHTKMLGMMIYIFLMSDTFINAQKSTLSAMDIDISCKVSNCMGWCGCQKRRGFTDIVPLRNECASNYNASYASAARCPDSRNELCLCKVDNANCKLCIADKANELMCFQQNHLTSVVQTCKNSRCYEVSKICGLQTPCLKCTRPSSTNRPNTFGPPYPDPPKHPQLTTPQKPSGGAGWVAGGVSNPSSTPASGLVGGPGGGPEGRTGTVGSNGEAIPSVSKHGNNGESGFKQEDGSTKSNNNVMPHPTENNTDNPAAKIVAIIACTVMLMISLVVMAIVIYKFRRHGRDRNQNDKKEEACNGYATIGDGNGHLNGHACSSRNRQFNNQLYDGAIIMNSGQNSSGPPIPLSERPGRSPLANTTEAYMVSTPLYKPSDKVNGSANVTYAAPLKTARQNIVRGIRGGYMSLKSVQKPELPWKGPHGERYNLEGYTELQHMVPNKSNNASTNSMKHSVSDNILYDRAAHEVQIWSRSLPSTLVRFPTARDSAAGVSTADNTADYDNPPSTIGYDYSVMSVKPDVEYYHKLEEGGGNNTMASSVDPYAMCGLNMNGASAGSPVATGSPCTSMPPFDARSCPNGASRTPSPSRSLDPSSVPCSLPSTSNSPGASLSSLPYYYKLQPDGEAGVTFVANRGCEALDTLSPGNVGDDDVFVEPGLESNGEVVRKEMAASQSECVKIIPIVSDGSVSADNEHEETTSV